MRPTTEGFEIGYSFQDMRWKFDCDGILPVNPASSLTNHEQASFSPAVAGLLVGGRLFLCLAEDVRVEEGIAKFAVWIIRVSELLKISQLARRATWTRAGGIVNSLPQWGRASKGISCSSSTGSNLLTPAQSLRHVK